jgi:hypothetical protein
MICQMCPCSSSVTLLKCPQFPSPQNPRTPHPAWRFNIITHRERSWTMSVQNMSLRVVLTFLIFGEVLSVMVLLHHPISLWHDLLLQCPVPCLRPSLVWLTLLGVLAGVIKTTQMQQSTAYFLRFAVKDHVMSVAHWRNRPLSSFVLVPVRTLVLIIRIVEPVVQLCVTKLFIFKLLWWIHDTNGDEVCCWDKLHLRFL